MGSNEAARENKPMSRKRRSAGREEDDQTLVAEVYRALGELGWTVPLCERDVGRAEDEQAEGAAALPEALRDPKAVFDRAAGPAGGPKVIPFPGAAEIDATLARAAREGGRLTPDIEQAMRHDREAAERELEEHQDTP